MNSLTGLQTARVWPEDAQDSSFRGEFSKKNTCQSPAKRVENFLTRAEVAQLVEQGTENPRVGSSILSLGTRESKGLQRKLQAFFRYGLLPDAHLRQPPGGASIGRAFPLFLLLSPPFPSSCLCPGSRDCPGVTGGFPIPPVFIRTGCAPEQHAACRISG